MGVLPAVSVAQAKYVAKVDDVLRRDPDLVGCYDVLKRRLAEGRADGGDGETEFRHEPAAL